MGEPTHYLCLQTLNVSPQGITIKWACVFVTEQSGKWKTACLLLVVTQGTEEASLRSVSRGLQKRDKESQVLSVAEQAQTLR